MGAGRTDAGAATERLTSDQTARAAAVLSAGGTVAIPTETVYGLAADAADDAAVAQIFAAKGRPAGHPLIVHVAAFSQVEAWADVSDPRVVRLAERFWPGPLTLILPRTDRVSSLVVGDRSTVGVRVPDHPVAQAVLDAFAATGSGGVAAPSANRFGHVSPTTAVHVLDDLDGRIDAVIDGGDARVGVESTILEIAAGSAPVLLRPGGVSVAEIESLLGESVADGRTGESRAAGMMASHYAPLATVEIASQQSAVQIDETTAVIGAVNAETVDGAAGVVLALGDEAAVFAAGLYRALRSADALGMKRIVVFPPTHGPLLDAVMDRLKKAAAPD